MEVVIDKIITNPNILKQISVESTMERVLDFDLINRLRASLKTGWTNGCGLSAIQIGIPLRFALYYYKGKEYTLLNPKIELNTLTTKLTTEACLSIPAKHYNIRRWYKIKYRNDEKVLEAKGIHARIIQHEIDHMNGKLISDLAKQQQRI